MFRYILAIILMACQFSAVAKFVKEQSPHINYVSFPVQALDGSVILMSAQYRLPRNVEGPMPAVVILHTTFGVDRTGGFYAEKLNNAGIATLELDMWGARGLTGGSEDRPGSPQETLPDAFSALAYLAQKPEIDASKIGVMGFSWGGVVSLLSATEQYNTVAGLPWRFAAHVAHYPVCWVYNAVPGFEFLNLTGSPVLIQTGDRDGYDVYPETCPNMVAQIPEEDQAFVEVKVYKNTYHTWDRLEPKVVVEDQFSNLGQGGEVLLKPHWRNAYKSRQKVVKFFEQAFTQTPE